MRTCLKCKAPVVETRIYCDRACTGTVPQHQGSLAHQLQELYVLANRNGLYDAADVVMNLIERNPKDC